MRTDPPQQDPRRLERSVRVGDCLRDTDLAAHAMRLAELSRRLRGMCPQVIGGDVELANVRDGHALFLATTSARAARLRQNQRQLRNLLLALDEPVDVIAVKVVQPRRASPARTPHNPLSAASAAHLRRAATSLDDPDLKAGLLRLASLAE